MFFQKIAVGIIIQYKFLMGRGELYHIFAVLSSIILWKLLTQTRRTLLSSAEVVDLRKLNKTVQIKHNSDSKKVEEGGRRLTTD